MESPTIMTDELYAGYLAEVARHAAFDLEPALADGARLVLLAALLENYEKGRFTIGRPDPEVGSGQSAMRRDRPV